MSALILYFKAKHAKAVHDWIIKNSGVLGGIKDLGRLESILDHIKNDSYYPTFADKLDDLLFSINKFHVFKDCSKRSSLSFRVYFLEINGYGYCVQKLVLEMGIIVVWLAENKISKALLLKIVTAILMDDDYSETLKL